MSSSSSATPASEYTMATATAKFSHGFPALLGLEFLEWEEGRVVVGMQVDERHLNLGRRVHGGVLATLLDVAGACAGTFCTVEVYSEDDTLLILGEGTFRLRSDSQDPRGAPIA